ncbi:uncharacterized protein TNCT_148041 [Trichonephila clavata]|uniref:Uncharacterized protein n=1 Tax=Trichonephila clavata TaxID=2740835 RepID=A0A8X6LK74_TRICU|nr:uncharacterized protein TNCT_148041 [Trichonephila clavata]
MDPMESQSFPNEEMFSLQSSPTLLPSNIEPFESPLLFQLHSSNEPFESPHAEVIQPLPNAEVIQPLPNHQPSTFLNSTEIHPADLKTGDEPVSVHYISPHDTISTIPTQRLSHYVTVTGNQHRNLFFLALRFKNPVIIQKHFGFSSCTLQMPKETCLLVDVNCPTLKLNLVQPTLLFTFQTRQGKSPTECELLQMLFPKNSLVVMQCYVRTLFVVSRCNPFQSMWTRIRKNGAFQGLVKMYYSCIAKAYPLTAQVASTLRLFKRIKTMSIDNFNTWYPLAQRMTTPCMLELFNHAPSIVFGRILFQILKRSSQHVLSPQHPPPEFYTCQTTLSDTDPVGIACCTVNFRVAYVSVMILSYTKEWFLDTNNMSCCFVPTNRNALCRFWFPLFKDKATWDIFGLGWRGQIKMVLKTLVDAILQSQRDPYNLLHVQLVQTLKKDISRDVTEAFTKSQPLVDQYPELYRSSSSFLDFLFKLCNVPSRPSPYCQGEDLKKSLASKVRELVSLQETLREKGYFYDTEKRDYEMQIKSWREKALQYEATIQSLQESISHYEVENSTLREKLTNCQAELNECLHRENNTLDGGGGLFVHSNNCFLEESPRPTALEFSSSEEPTHHALEYPSQNERVLGEMVEWKQELRSFLEQFKKDMSTNFTLTKEQNEKISKVLETLHPVSSSEPSEPSAEPTVSVDEISTKLFDTFEQLLHRKLSKDHLKHMLKTFQLDDHFNSLEINIRSAPQLGKTSRQKVLTHVNHTKYKVKEVIESFFQKLSTLFGSDLPSLYLMERLDFLEEKYLAKNTQLAEELSKLKEFVRQYFPEIAFSENWQELFSNEVKSFTERITSFQESLKNVATRWNFHYIPGLEHGWFETMEKKLQYSQALEKQLMDTNMKLNSIYEKMLSNLDYNTKMTALQNPTTLDQQFFDWVRNGVQQLRNDLDAARTQLVQAIESPSNYEVTEVVENLPAICGIDIDSELKQERDHLKVERDQLKEENDHLKTERNQLKGEKGQLMIENGLLKENRDIFWRETEILRNEKDVLKVERDQCLKGSDRLKKKTNLLKVEGDNGNSVVRS